METRTESRMMVVDFAGLQAGLPAGWRVIPAGLAYARGVPTWVEVVVAVAAPWGVFYVDRWEEGVLAQVHGVFGGPGVWREVCEIRTFARLLLRVLRVGRLEVQVLGEGRGVRRLLAAIGFTREGVLRRAAATPGSVQDAEMWSIILGDAGFPAGGEQDG